MRESLDGRVSRTANDDEIKKVICDLRAVFGRVIDFPPVRCAIFWLSISHVACICIELAIGVSQSSIEMASGQESRFSRSDGEVQSRL